MRLSLNCLEYNHVLYQNLYFKVSRTASFQQLSSHHYIRHSIWGFQPSAPCSNFCPSSRNGDFYQVCIKNKLTVIAIVLFNTLLYPRHFSSMSSKYLASRSHFPWTQHGKPHFPEWSSDDKRERDVLKMPKCYCHLSRFYECLLQHHKSH